MSGGAAGLSHTCPRCNTAAAAPLPAQPEGCARGACGAAAPTHQCNPAHSRTAFTEVEDQAIEQAAGHALHSLKGIAAQRNVKQSKQAQSCVQKEWWQVLVRLLLPPPPLLLELLLPLLYELALLRIQPFCILPKLLRVDAQEEPPPGGHRDRCRRRPAGRAAADCPHASHHCAAGGQDRPWLAPSGLVCPHIGVQLVRLQRSRARGAGQQGCNQVCKLTAQFHGALQVEMTTNKHPLLCHPPSHCHHQLLHARALLSLAAVRRQRQQRRRWWRRQRCRCVASSAADAAGSLDRSSIGALQGACGQDRPGRKERAGCSRCWGCDAACRGARK